jgi:hypothetical protein
MMEVPGSMSEFHWKLQHISEMQPVTRSNAPQARHASMFASDMPQSPKPQDRRYLRNATLSSTPALAKHAKANMGALSGGGKALQGYSAGALVRYLPQQSTPRYTWVRNLR